MPELLRRHFRAMGCRATIVVRHDDAERAATLAERGRHRIAHLERCWSRFDDTSDVSAINRADGRAVAVDPSTLELVSRMVSAWRTSSGACHPAWRGAARLEPQAIESVEIDVDRQTIRIPAGLQLDPGCLGKGLASDLVADQSMAAGALGVLIEIGGDLRASGHGPHEGLWSIGVEDPFGDPDRGESILVSSVGVSTSGLNLTGATDGPDNTTVDPWTGEPIIIGRDRVVAATVIASTGVEAETWSTALLVRGDGDLSDLSIRGLVGRVVRGDGEIQSTSEWCRPAVGKEEVRV